jgi:hypothetical protein
MSAMVRPISKKQKAEVLALETNRRRRADGLCVLAAVGNLARRELDVQGCAKTTLDVFEIAGSAQVSRKATARALSHWRSWRVLWLAWRGHRTWEVRFQREVVDKLLSLPAREIGSFLDEHKRRREGAVELAK